jgi:hypothetical protein
MLFFVPVIFITILPIKDCMNLLKSCALSLMLLTSYAAATINCSIAIIRNGDVVLGSPVLLELQARPVKAYQDELTYIEAELVSESDNMPMIKLTVATKNETGTFAVRGVPRISTALVNGMNMASLKCDSAQEKFTLMIAVAKA